MTEQLLLVRQLAIENLRRSTAPRSEQQLGRAVLQALVQAGIDLRHGPSLEETKQILAEVRAPRFAENAAQKQMVALCKSPESHGLRVRNTVKS